MTLDRVEVQPEVDHTEVESDFKELESIVEASEDKDAEAALEKIAGGRSDNLNPGIVFHGTNESEQEVEASELNNNKFDSERETDGEPVWGSGSSRSNSDITSKVLLYYFILSLSHVL